MARSKTGQAISAKRRTAEELDRLDELVNEAEKAGDLATWKRARAVRGYVDGEKVAEIHKALRVRRGTVNQWLRWYEVMGAEGLRTGKPPGAAPRLSVEQREELSRAIEAGPMGAGFTSGVWTGPMIGQLIFERYGVRYHNHHVPRLLNQLGFSVQRPRKRLARADAESQATWQRDRLPEIHKKPRPAVGSECSRTRRASGSMGRCTRRGRGSGSSRGSTPSGCARPRTSPEPSASMRRCSAPSSRQCSTGTPSMSS